MFIYYVKNISTVCEVFKQAAILCQETTIKVRSLSQDQLVLNRLSIVVKHIHLGYSCTLLTPDEKVFFEPEVFIESRVESYHQSVALRVLV